jgi:hypothetical protein
LLRRQLPDGRIGPPVHAEQDGLAVDDKRADGVAQRGFGNVPAGVNWPIAEVKAALRKDS